ncbi:TPA: hypothetical protein ACIVB1_000493 [Salmonella enterica subsp. diarizonae serovar 61:l,v:z35]
MTTFHPAPWVLTEYNRRCPDVFKNADTFRKTDPDSPWWFMTSRQCQAWLKDYPSRPLAGLPDRTKKPGHATETGDALDTAGFC